MSEQLEGFGGKVSWHRHSCNLCRKTVHENGAMRSVKASVIDGITPPGGPVVRYGSVHMPWSTCPEREDHVPGHLACQAHRTYY
ncbi:unnamed protein product, partial [Ectocarpus sp. 6 AP-2014]